MKQNYTEVITTIPGRLLWLIRRSALILLSAWCGVSVQGAGLQVLHGHSVPLLKSLTSTSVLPATNRLNLAISLPLRNAAALSNLLHEIYDPTSTNYHRYLTPAEFTEKFGPTGRDYEAVVTFAKASHLQVVTTHPNRVLLDVSGSVADVEKALHLTMRNYQHPKEKRQFYAPDREPSLDLAVPVLQINGLDNYALPRPHLRASHRNNGQNASPNVGSGPSGSYMGNDFRKAYASDSALNGSGQVVGLLQFDGYNTSDITYYENKAGLPNIPLQNVLLDGFNGSPTFNGGEVEVSLDIEMAISMATNLSKVIVYEAGPSGSWHDLLNRMANDNLARQLSSSWYISGGGADVTADQIFQQMAAQGQSFFNASGDKDAYSGLIDFPGDSPYITQVGGTTLSTSPIGAWVAETVWNWGVERGTLYDGQGSGGGVSTHYSIPSWQTNISMAANQGSLTSRNTPDVAMIADNIYVRADGTDLIEAGTSCAAPLWAGFAALVNQQAASLAQPSIGFVNPALAALGAGPNYTAAFHDITTGNNTWSSSPSKFYAVSGYDLCTGWGTPAGQKLIDSLANPEPLLITPGNGFTGIGGVGGPFTVFSQAFSLIDVGANSLTWTVSNTASWLNILPSGGALTPGGPAATVTASLNNGASNLAVGTYMATLWFTNVNDGIGQSRQIVLSVISPPTITLQPTNQTLLEGETAGFRVQAAGGLPLAYQWQFGGTNLADGGNILGASTTNLTIDKVSAANVGSYAVVVTNFAGMVTSSIAALTITSSPPVIVLQPTNEAVYVGTTVSFSVGTIGTVPFFYQWSFNGTNIVNATNATLTLVGVQLTNAGNYSVVVTNLYGSTNSANAVLSVSAGMACDPVPFGIVAWWQAENNALDSVGTNNGVPVGGITYNGGKVGQAFSLDGSSTYISVPASPSLDIGSAGTGFTIEGWINPGALTMQYGAPIIEWDSDSAIGVHFWAQDSLYANIISTDGNTHNMQSAGGVITSGVLQHVALTYDQASGTAVFYCNGTAVLTQNLGSFVPQTTYPVNIGRRTGNVVGSGYNFQGLIDELSVYRRVLSSNEIAAIYMVGSGGKCFAPTPPVITTQPTNQTVAVGSTAVFGVTASGTTPLHYQWSFNGTNCVNGTNATLTLTNVQINQSGNYSVLVTNLYGLTNSSTAALTIYGVPPVITTQPTNQTVAVGSTAVFGVTASGTTPLYYQWSFNGTNIVGGTNAILMMTNVQFNQAGNYTVAVTNFYGLTNSAIAVLTVNALSSCDPIPSGIAAWWRAEGNAMDMINGNNGTLVGNVGFIPGEVGQAFSLDGSSTYISVPASQSLDIGSAGTGITIEAWINPAGLTIQYSAPVVEWDSGTAIGLHFWASDSLFANVIGTDGNPHTIQSGSGLITQGVLQHVAFTYDRASGTAILYCNGNAVTTQNLGSIVPQTTYPLNIGRRTGSVTGSGYNFAGVIDELSLYRRALSSNEIAAIYLAGNGGKCFTPTPPVITTQPTNQSVAVGGTAGFVVTASGTPPLFYQWSFNGTNIVNGTNATLTMTNVQLGQSGNYSVVVTNLYGSTNSTVAVLTVYGVPPVITTQPTNHIIQVGGTTNFGVIATGTAPLFYQWNFNGTNILGATNSTLTLTNVQSSQAGNYAVSITNAYGYTVSSNAILSVILTLDHFVWNTIASTQYANLPFSATITAQNVYGVTVTNFTGALSLQASIAPSNTSLILNGGFETGTLANWTQVKSSSGQFVINNGTVNPPSPDGALSPYAGSYSALGDDSGAGVFYLYQDVSIPSGISTATLSWAHRVRNFYSAFNFGQAFQVRICDTNNNILATAFTTSPGDVLLGSWVQTNYNLAAFAGTKVRVMFWVDVTTSYFDLHLDSVNLQAMPNLTITPTNTGNFVNGIWTGNIAVQQSVTNVLLIANDGNGHTNSSNPFNVLQGPPILAAQPQSQTNLVGETAWFNVAAIGTTPLSYQWSFNGTNIASATNAALALNNVQLNQAGNYSVSVSNLIGLTNSASATLTVIDALDHFTWNTIPSPRVVGVPFGVVIQARDSINQVFTNFTGVVSLTETNGTSVDPLVSGVFAQGIWSGSVAISQAGANLVLRATDGTGHSGLAKSITTLATPSLTMARSGSSLLIYWPMDPAGFVLETSTNLVPPQWTQVTDSPMPIGNQYLEFIQFGGTNQFYRLRYTLP